MSSAEVTAIRVREALAAQRRGWMLTPLRGKRPYLRDWQNAPPPTDEQVREWAQQGNVGLRTGSASGIVVIDDDSPDRSGAARLHLPRTVTVLTGSGKQHLYFRAPEHPLGNSASKLAPRVDVRGQGGQVVYVGSIHPTTGHPYAWAEGQSPSDLEIAELPEAVVRALCAPSPAAPVASRSTAGHALTSATEELARAARAVAEASEGTRNDTLNKQAFLMGTLVTQGCLAISDVERELTDAALGVGLEPREVRDTLQSALQAGLRETRQTGRATRARRPLTDMGNAERLVARFGDLIRYCHPWRTWLLWDGRRWRHDNVGHVMRLAKDTVRLILEEAAEETDDETRREILKWQTTSEKVDRLRAMVTLAQSEPRVVVLPIAFDRDPYALNVNNGTIDLKSGTLRPHGRDDLITKLCPVAYDVTATCPRWRAFLERVLPDAEVRSFVQRAAGYSLTADIREHVIVFLYGPAGANGKTTLLRTLQDLLGTDFAIQAAPGLLLDTRNRNHPTEVADLYGVRLAVSSEVSSRQHFDEVLLKQLTGGDRIRARRMREDYWEFTPSHHLWLAANHRPRVDGTDDAVWRRMLLVPFDVQIPEDARDPRLLETLKSERAGILTWALEGCAQWQLGGLAPPDAVRAATRHYREAMDGLEPFLAECCEQQPTAQVGATDLYRAYQVWCRASGEGPLSQTAFGQHMTQRGFGRTKRGIVHYVGLRLRGPGQGARVDGQGGSGPSFGMNALGGAREGAHVERWSRPSPSVPRPGFEAESGTKPPRRETPSGLLNGAHAS